MIMLTGLKFYILVICFNFYVFASTVTEPETVDQDPDVTRNVSQLITSKGYPVEEYEVPTKNGYIIGVQRIPEGRKKSSQKEQRPVVLLHHGLLGAATDYLLNSAEQSLGYILADSGYDVWLTNARGNIYSKKHATLSPKSSAYWQFSWDEMALEDLPAVVDFILKTTGQEKLFLVGGSMGSTITFAFLSEYPEYNDKIRLAVALCPVAFIGNIKTALRLLIPFANEIAALDGIISHDEFLPGSPFERMVTESLCTQAPIICQNFVFALAGASPKQFIKTRSAVYLGHYPAGTSAFTVLHYAQLIKSKAFRKFDYGAEENVKRYGQTTPPDYPLQNITAPVALMWGLNDPTADPADVNLLAPLLQNLVISYPVPDPEWSHVDFFIGIDANKLVYQKMLDILKDY